jgi:hypothetical protein
MLIGPGVEKSTNWLSVEWAAPLAARAVTFRGGYRFMASAPGESQSGFHVPLASKFAHVRDASSPAV